MFFWKTFGGKSYAAARAGRVCRYSSPVASDSVSRSETWRSVLFEIEIPCINNSLHLARKYARIFVRGHYLFREANSFPRAKLEENCELRGTDNVQGQISVHIFEDKWRLLCLLSFKYFSKKSRARDLLRICQQIL